MKYDFPWPGINNKITGIKYKLLKNYDDNDKQIFKKGNVSDKTEIEKVQKILEQLKPHPAQLSAKPTGYVEITLEDNSKVTLLPIFHLPNNTYQDLFKVKNYDCPVPKVLADIFNSWRN